MRKKLNVSAIITAVLFSGPVFASSTHNFAEQSRSHDHTDLTPCLKVGRGVPCGNQAANSSEHTRRNWEALVTAITSHVDASSDKADFRGFGWTRNPRHWNHTFAGPVAANETAQTVDTDSTAGNGNVTLSTDITNVFRDDNIITSFEAVTQPAQTSVAAVPVPAAAWLFGSGLLGLAGTARRKCRAS